MSIRFSYSSFKQLHSGNHLPDIAGQITKSRKSLYSSLLIKWSVSRLPFAQWGCPEVPAAGFRSPGNSCAKEERKEPWRIRRVVPTNPAGEHVSPSVQLSGMRT